MARRSVGASLAVATLSVVSVLIRTSLGVTGTERREASVLRSPAMALLARLVGSFLLYNAVTWTVWLLLTRGQSNPSPLVALSIGVWAFFIPVWAFLFWGIGRMHGYRAWAMRSRGGGWRHTTSICLPRGSRL